MKATVRFKLPSCVGLGSSGKFIFSSFIHTYVDGVVKTNKCIPIFGILGAYCVCIATALLQTTGLIPSPSIVVGFD